MISQPAQADAAQPFRIARLVHARNGMPLLEVLLGAFLSIDHGDGKTTLPRPGHGFHRLLRAAGVVTLDDDAALTLQCLVPGETLTCSLAPNPSLAACAKKARSMPLSMTSPIAPASARAHSSPPM